MFRTWYANYHLLNYLRQHQQHFISNSAKDKRAQQQCLNDAVTYVSEKLNNSHAISRKAYVSNGVFNVILNNPRKFVRELPAQTELHQYLAKIMKEIA
jgi:DNA topoisomerase IB